MYGGEKQMTTEEMLRELKATREEEKNKFVDTCCTNWYNLLGDVINKIEELEEHNTSYELANSILTDKNTELIEQNAALIFNNKEQRKEIELGRQELFNANKWATHFEEQLELCKKSNLTKKELIEELKEDKKRLDLIDEDIMNGEIVQNTEEGCKIWNKLVKKALFADMVMSAQNDDYADLICKNGSELIVIDYNGKNKIFKLEDWYQQKLEKEEAND